jgi:hypothetical protein
MFGAACPDTSLDSSVAPPVITGPDGVRVGVGVNVAQEQQPDMFGLFVGRQTSLPPQTGF